MLRLSLISLMSTGQCQQAWESMMWGSIISESQLSETWPFIPTPERTLEQSHHLSGFPKCLSFAFFYLLPSRLSILPQLDFRCAFSIPSCNLFTLWTTKFLFTERLKSVVGLKAWERLVDCDRKWWRGTQKQSSREAGKRCSGKKRTKSNRYRENCQLDKRIV